MNILSWSIGKFENEFETLYVRDFLAEIILTLEVEVFQYYSLLLSFIYRIKFESC